MLILCEKPSVAKDFAGALGASGKKGFYEGGGNVITYCVGHLFSLESPDGYDEKYKKWTLEDLPIIPKEFRYVPNPSTADQTKTVVELLKAHAKDDVLIATDAGREGELIARIALKEAGIKDISRFKRFWVSEALTREVILNGIKNAKPLAEYDTVAAQGFARQEADWLVGMNLSRFMSIGNPPPPFSVGRVQTAVLAAIAGRNEEVKNFVPLPYKQLPASISSENGVTVKALLENPKTGKTSFFPSDDDLLSTAASSCKNKKITSVDVEAKEKRNKPEKLLNITGLQKIAFKKFGYKPEETLSLAQSLYETHKCLSYPRTPSRVMGDNNVGLFREKFELLKGDYAASSLCDISLISADNKHIFNSAQLEDHHALIPLAALPGGTSEKEKNVYTVVLESFFRVCMRDFVYNEKSLRFYADDFVFTCKIREVIQQGWREAFGDDSDDAEETVSAFDEKNCSVASLTILEKKTEPKKEYAIDTLLAFMEHPRDEGEKEETQDKREKSEKKLVGLGTPATRAEIIKTLFLREYVREEKKKLICGGRGAFLLKCLTENEHLKKIADVAETTEWEERLNENPDSFTGEIAAFVSLCVKAAPGRALFEKQPIGKCPLCGKPVFENKAAYGCSGYKEEPKCLFAIWKTIAGATVSGQEAALLLEGQKTKVKKCKNKDGKPFEAAFALEGGKLVFKFKDR